MIRISGLSLPLTYTDHTLRKAAARALRLPAGMLTSCKLARRAVDARHGQVSFIASADVTVDGDEAALVRSLGDPSVKVVDYTPYRLPACLSGADENRPVVVGSGPAGLFAALALANAGLRPLLLERGQDVDTRTRDVERFWRTGELDPSSNIPFGEGGAGTFSDGKLHTGIGDTRCRFVLEQLALHGDAEDLLWQARPHAGTDRLKRMVRGLRQAIERQGGAVRFGCTVTDLQVENGRLRGLVLGGGEEVPCKQAVFAIGHSARDTFDMLYRRGVRMEQKPFAIGVRIEHPRERIDRSQYGKFAGHPALGAADYRLSVRPPGERGVYTFCMCPGGEVVAAASEEGGVATNGMSAFRRDARNSNSALLVGVGPGDFPSDHPLSGVAFQRQWERAAYRLGGGGYRAPAQLLADFLQGCPSPALGEVEPSYRPGVTLCDLRECLPPAVTRALGAALPLLGRKLRGFDRPDAVLTGVESRSSSPVRLLRDEQGESSVRGLYPCGEGAGYAGGIVSAAVDGLRCAEWVIAARE